MFGFRWVQRIRMPFGFRSSITRNGLGFSWGIPGLRFGVSPAGRKWMSIGFPGLGLYFFRYLGVEKSFQNDLSTEDGLSNASHLNNASQKRDLKWNQLNNRNKPNASKTSKWKNLN